MSGPGLLCWRGESARGLRWHAQRIRPSGAFLRGLGICVVVVASWWGMAPAWRR